MAGRKKDRPGVMLYFDSVRPALNRLDDTQCGQLFRAVVDYAEYGVVPELDALVGMVFDLLVPKIDRDAEKYEETREQRQYAVYCREKQKAGEPYLKIAEWRLSRSKPPSNENIGSYLSTSPSGNTARKETVEGYKGDGEGKPLSTQRDTETDFEKKRQEALAKLSAKSDIFGYM